MSEESKPSKFKRLIRVAIDLFFLAAIGGFCDFFLTLKFQEDNVKKSLESWPCDLHYY